MKPHLLDRSSSQNRSFTVNHHIFPNFLKVWHYHTEFELILVVRSVGTRFIGDNIEKFKPGELVLIGKNLPHMWLNDEHYYKEGHDLTAEAMVVHFRDDFAGRELFHIPELGAIQSMIERARQGISFTGKGVKGVEKRFKKLMALEGYDQFIELLNMLKVLADEKSYRLLSTEGFIHSFEQAEKRKLDDVYGFVVSNFKRHITLDEVAGIANMNPSAFSRYFKRVNRKTFTHYLNEIRIGYACKLLIDNKHNVTEICYMSGFNNVSNFNKQFRRITNYSPTQYIQFHSSGG